MNIGSSFLQSEAKLACENKEIGWVEERKKKKKQKKTLKQATENAQKLFQWKEEKTAEAKELMAMHY